MCCCHATDLFLTPPLLNMKHYITALHRQCQFIHVLYTISTCLSAEDWQYGWKYTAQVTDLKSKQSVYCVSLTQCHGHCWNWCGRQSQHDQMLQLTINSSDRQAGPAAAVYMVEWLGWEQRARLIAAIESLLHKWRLNLIQIVALVGWACATTLRPYIIGPMCNPSVCKCYGVCVGVGV